MGVTIDPLVSLLVGALGASLIGLIGALVGSAIQGRREHARWVREQRMESYRAFIQAAERMPELDSRGVTDRDEQFFDDFQNALAGVRLVGPPAVTNAAVDYLGAAYKSKKAAVHAESKPKEDAEAQRVYLAAREAFVVAARRELDIGTEQKRGGPIARVGAAVNRRPASSRSRS